MHETITERLGEGLRKECRPPGDLPEAMELLLKRLERPGKDGPRGSRKGVFRRIALTALSRLISLARLISLVALSGLNRRLGLLAAIGSKGPANVVALAEAAFGITPYIALVALMGFDEFAFAGHENSLFGQ
jgi:hypothetical protein